MLQVEIAQRVYVKANEEINALRKLGNYRVGDGIPVCASREGKGEGQPDTDLTTDASCKAITTFFQIKVVGQGRTDCGTCRPSIPKGINNG